MPVALAGTPGAYVYGETPIDVPAGESYYAAAAVGPTVTPSTSDYTSAIFTQAQAQVDAALASIGSVNTGSATDYLPVAGGPVGGSTPIPVTAPIDTSGTTASGSGGDTSATGSTSKPGGTLGPTGSSAGSSLSLGTGGLNVSHVLILLGLLVGAYYVIGHRKGIERFAAGRK